MAQRFIGLESLALLIKFSTTVARLPASRITIGGQQYVNASNADCSVSTTGIGGLDTGTVLANRLYYVFAVPNGTTYGLVASLTSTPTGYSQYKLVGRLVTNGSSQIEFAYGVNQKGVLGYQVFTGSSGNIGSSGADNSIFSSVLTPGIWEIQYSFQLGQLVGNSNITRTICYYVFGSGMTQLNPSAQGLTNFDYYPDNQAGNVANFTTPPLEVRISGVNNSTFNQRQRVDWVNNGFLANYKLVCKKVADLEDTNL